MSDPRLGKVSASRFEILALCAGSEQLRRTLPAEALDTSDEYSDSGTRIHYARQTGNTLALSPEETEIYKRGCETEKRILEQWLSDFNIEPNQYFQGEVEERLYLNDPSTLKPVTSGQLDVHYVAPSHESHVLVIDLKALWSPNLTPAERNWQGRLQAVLASIEYDAVHVRMAFNKAMWGKSDQADYDKNALEYAKQSIFAAIWESEQPGAQFRPGRWCTYCPCKAYCSDAVAYAQLPTVSTFNGDPVELVKWLPLEDLVPVWRKKSLVTKIFDAIVARLKALDDTELNRLGLKLAPGRKLDKLKDVRGAFQKLLEEGYTEEEIFRCMTINKGNFEDMVKQRTNCRDIEAKAFYESTLAEFIEPGNAEPSLKEL